MERLMIHMWNITWKVVFGHFAVIWRSFGLHFESCGLRRDSSIFNQFQKSSKSKNYFDFWNPNFGFLTARYHYKQIRPLCLTIINHDEPLLNHISLCERKKLKNSGFKSLKYHFRFNTYLNLLFKYIQVNSRWDSAVLF